MLKTQAIESQLRWSRAKIEREPPRLRAHTALTNPIIRAYKVYADYTE